VKLKTVIRFYGPGTSLKEKDRAQGDEDTVHTYNV